MFPWMKICKYICSIIKFFLLIKCHTSMIIAWDLRKEIWNGNCLKFEKFLVHSMLYMWNNLFYIQLLYATMRINSPPSGTWTNFKFDFILGNFEIKFIKAREIEKLFRNFHVNFSQFSFPSKLVENFDEIINVATIKLML